MFKINRKIKKIFAIVLIFSIMSLQIIPVGAQAGVLSGLASILTGVFVPSKIANMIGLPFSLFSKLTGAVTKADSATTKVETAMENNTLNNAKNQVGGTAYKIDPPRVDVVFSSEGSAKPGSQMTATATPGFFKDASDLNKLYFTWYLKREGCELTDPKNPTGRYKITEGNAGKLMSLDKSWNASTEKWDDSGRGNCDLDDDKIITVNDWKIAAAQIIVRGSFDPNETGNSGTKIVDYEGAVNGEGGFEAYPAIKNSDVDAWRKGMLLDGSNPYLTNVDDRPNDSNGALFVPNCYLRDMEGGVDFELRKQETTVVDCPVGTERRCAKFSDGVGLPSCSVLNPAYDLAADNATKAQIADNEAYNAPIKAMLDAKVAATVGSVCTEPVPQVMPEPVCAYVAPADYPHYTKPYPYASQSKTPPNFCYLTDTPGSETICQLDNKIQNLLEYTATAKCRNGETAVCVNSSTTLDYFIEPSAINLEAARYDFTPSIFRPDTRLVDKDGNDLIPGTLRQEELSSETVLNGESQDANFPEHKISNGTFVTQLGGYQTTTWPTWRTYAFFSKLVTPYFVAAVDAAASGIIFRTKNDFCKAFAPNDPAKSGVPLGNAMWLDKINPILEDVVAKNLSCAESAKVVGASSSCKFTPKQNLCTHLFPLLPKKDYRLSNGIPQRTVNMGDVISGDGNFTPYEKQFWGANPAVPKTNGIQKDEEAVIGRGVDKFTWILAEGDQVGVAVEGDSGTPEEHSGSSYKRTWAFSKAKCSEVEKATRGVYIEGPGGTVCDLKDKSKCLGFLTTDADPNDCLPENLLNPVNTEADKAVKVQLSATPENPINEPAVGDLKSSGDLLTVSSEAANVESLPGVTYDWSVLISKSFDKRPTNTTEWSDITNNLISNKSFSLADQKGIDKSSLAIKLNLPNTDNNAVSEDYLISNDLVPGKHAAGLGNAFYLKVRVKITSNAADAATTANGASADTIKDSIQTSIGEVIVRVAQRRDKIEAYTVNASDTGMLTTGDAFCVNAKNCYVKKNKIVGLKLSGTNIGSNPAPFSWKVNGNPVTCDDAMSIECSTSNNGKTMFIPILGNVGESVNVVARGVSANSKKNEFIEITKKFIISKDGFLITTNADPATLCDPTCMSETGPGACPKFLGQYNDINYPNDPTHKTNDCSKTVWQTNKSQIAGVTETVTFLEQPGFQWEVDGQVVAQSGDLNLPIEKPVGDTYSIALSPVVSAEGIQKLKNIALALYKHWKIVPEEAMDESAQQQGTSIQLEVLANPAIAAAKNNSFMASLVTHLPTQILFLLRISLTAMLLLFVTGLLFAFIPETSFEDKKL